MSDRVRLGSASTCCLNHFTFSEKGEVEEGVEEARESAGEEVERESDWIHAAISFTGHLLIAFAK